MPAGHSRTVCDLRPLSVVRALFGHYSDLGLSPRKQQIIQVYCALAPLIWISARVYFRIINNNFLAIFNFIHYIFYYCVSMYTKSIFMYEYFNFIPVLDGPLNSGKVHSKLKRLLLGFTIISFIEASVVGYKNYVLQGHFGVITGFLYSCYYSLSRVPSMFIFSLLYCRAKKFRKYLVSTDVRVNLGRKLVLAYTALGASLEKTGVFPILLVFIHISAWFVNIMYEAFQVVRFVKSENQEVDSILLLTRCLFIALDTFIVFQPSIMMELVSEELERSRVFIADQLLTCTDEVKRKTLEELQYFMRRQPIELTAWQVVPVNGKLPLALVAVGANYLVCALQFSNTFGSAGNRTNTTAAP